MKGIEGRVRKKDRREGEGRRGREGKGKKGRRERKERKSKIEGKGREGGIQTGRD